MACLGMCRPGWGAPWPLLPCSCCGCGAVPPEAVLAPPPPARGKEPGPPHPRRRLQPREPCCEAQAGPLLLILAVPRVRDHMGLLLFKKNLKAGQGVR